ncbi:MAG: SprT family zinc-dependent metalloprotease [bacterium]
MKKHIELHKRKVEYTIKVSNRARRMRLAIYCDGNFVVTAPTNIAVNTIEQFIIKKSQWILDKLDYFGSFSKTFITKNSDADYTKYKQQAQELAEKKVAKFNKIYKIRFNKINIKNQKTRWGSCSRKGNLNFNYKIVLLPDKLVNYIIVHELCHLKEFNHSQKFWNLVSKTIFEYSDIRKELKNIGLRFC